MQVRVVIAGRHYDMAESVPKELILPPECTVDAALEALQESLPNGQRLPESCLLAVSGVHLGTVGKHRTQQLRNGDELLLLAPVAGG
jgi:hypothetical protein